MVLAGGNIFSLSVERKNNSRPHTVDNILLVCRSYQTWGCEGWSPEEE